VGCLSRLLSVAVNSGYSFWWDVTNDWGLSILQMSTSSANPRTPSPARPFILPQRHESHPAVFSLPVSQDEDQRSFSASVSASQPTLRERYSRGLRPTLLFHDPIVYYIAISLNLVLRLTWSLKLSSHLHSVAELESGVFLLEALELIRRWVWVFFRVEWEAVKKGFEGRVSNGVWQEETELESLGRNDDGP